jgi:hypothetical protein
VLDLFNQVLLSVVVFKEDLTGLADPTQINYTSPDDDIHGRFRAGTFMLSFSFRHN